MKTSAIILNNAEQFAEAVDPRKFDQNKGKLLRENGIVSSVEHHHHYHGSPYLWYFNPYPNFFGGWGNPYCFRQRYVDPCGASCSNNCSSSKKREEPSRSHLFLVIFAIAGLVGSYFVGKEIGYIASGSRELRKLDCVEVTNDSVKEVVDKQKEMLREIKNRSIKELAFKSILTGSALAGGLGVVFAAPAVTMSGVLLGAGAGSALLFRRGYLDADTTLIEKADELRSAVKGARQSLG